MTYYYRNNGAVYVSPIPLKKFEEITEEEYNEIMKSLEPTPEEIKALKMAELRRLADEINAEGKEE